MLKGLQLLNKQTKMEGNLGLGEEPSSSETTVDVAVKVAESVADASEEIDELDNETADLDQDIDTQEEVSDNIDTLQKYALHIKKHGTTQATFDLMKDNLASVLPVLPARESLSSIGRNEIHSQQLLSGINSVIATNHEKLQVYLANTIDKATKLANKVHKKTPKWKSSVEQTFKIVKNASVAEESFKNKTYVGYSIPELNNMCKAIMSVCADSKKMLGLVKIAEGNKITVESPSKAIKTTAMEKLGLSLQNGILSHEVPKTKTIKMSSVNKNNLNVLRSNLIAAFDSFAQMKDTIAKLKNSTNISVIKKSGVVSDKAIRVYQDKKMTSVHNCIRLASAVERQLKRIQSNYTKLCAQYCKKN